MVRTLGFDFSASEAQISEAQLCAGFRSLDEALTELAESLRSVAGQKHVIYLSAGASSAALLGIAEDTSVERAQIEAMNEDSMRGNVAAVNSNARFRLAVEGEGGLALELRTGLSLEPGRYQLRLLVRESGSGATSTRSLEVEIPARALHK